MNTMNQNLTRLTNRLQTLSWEPWLLVASGVFMAHISWLKWPDLVIDFGEQAYIAWRLSEGAVLYKDIVYFYGPLSSTIHAFLFKLFGPQLMALIVFNLILVAALTVVIYKLFLFTGSRLSATMAAFPTGTLLNYLVRKENPITSISYNPGTWKLLGEQRVLKDLQATPPTYIVIVYHDFLEFGYRFFGKDFGKGIYQWISEDYASFKLIGKDPVKEEGFGIQILKRKPPPQPNPRSMMVPLMSFPRYG